jgi:hypothetical protein
MLLHDLNALFDTLATKTGGASPSGSPPSDLRALRQ